MEGGAGFEPSYLPSVLTVHIRMCFPPISILLSLRTSPQTGVAISFFYGDSHVAALLGMTSEWGRKSANSPYSVVRPGQELIETEQLWDAAYTPTAQRVHIPQLAVSTGIRMCTMSTAVHV